MHLVHIALLLLSVAGTQPATRFDVEPAELEYLIAGMQHNLSKVHTLSWTVEESARFADGSEGEEVFAYCYKDGKEWIRRIRSDREVVEWDVKAWNGERTRALGRERGKLVGYVSPGDTWMRGDSPVRRCWPHIAWAGRMAGDGEVRITGTDYIDGEECRVVEFLIASGAEGDAVDRYWIAPAQGFSILRRETTQLPDGHLFARYDYSWTRKGDIWYPSRYEVQFFDRDDEPVPPAGAPLSKAERKIRAAQPEETNPQIAGKTEFRDVQLNHRIDDSRFELKFPAGTTVLDHATMTEYTIGAAPQNSDDAMDILIADLAGSEKGATRTGPTAGGAGGDPEADAWVEKESARFEGDHEGPYSRYWLPRFVLLLAVVLGGICIYVVIRRKGTAV